MEQELADIDTLRKKKFCLERLAPYLRGEIPYGYDKVKDKCEYFNKETGAMCIAGGCMIAPEKSANYSIDMLIYKDQSCFKPEFREILTREQWKHLQFIHDVLATNKNEWSIRVHIEKIDLFTYEEMMALKN